MRLTGFLTTPDLMFVSAWLKVPKLMIAASELAMAFILLI